MREVSTAVIKRLDLKNAVEAEAAAWRNLLPREPWTAKAESKSGYFASWVTTRLTAGDRNAPGWVVDVRKAHQAFRPVPIIGVAERVAYRALTEWVLKDDDDLPSRSKEAYRDFVLGPIRHALPGEGPLSLADATVDYVVHADIAACYQYIDHGVLLRELESRTGKIAEARLLVELLGEIQGATYGLPQLLDASDMLSEVYLQILERAVTRRVGPVWRFNDDFRLAVKGYGNAQQALEDLAAAARPLGLVLNEQKSNIMKFGTYFIRHFAPDFSDEADEGQVNPAELELWDETTYPDLEEGASIEAALETLERLEQGATNPIDLKNSTAQDVKDLRWAFTRLTTERAPQGLDFVAAVFDLVPQLTPRLGDYLVAVHAGGESIAEVWLAIAEESGTQNAWQRAWITYVARECGLTTGPALDWLLAQHQAAPTGLLHAETTLALAQAGEMSFETVDSALRAEPEALTPWYALALNHVGATDEQLKAVRGSSALCRLLVDEPSSGSGS